MCIAGPLPAATFYCDPANGSVAQAGTAEKPWGPLEEVIARGLIEIRGADGTLANPGAVVKAGDTVLLRDGYHGNIRIKAGCNEEFITIAAEAGHKPGVGQVVIDGGRRWRVKGLLVSPSLAPRPPGKEPRHLVMLGEHGDEDSGWLEVEDCFVFSLPDASSWSAEDWVNRPASGIWLGRHGRAHAARNNFILNTRMGIDVCAPDCICEGNVIDGFSGDGIRVTRDGIEVRHNVIRNNFVGAADGDDNHDDGIQSFLFNKGRGLVRNVVIEGNVIVQRSQPGLPFPNPLQGIGFFDGPLVNYRVENNAVVVDHWHAVSLYDAQDCLIRGNAAWNPVPGSKHRPWVLLGAKQGLAKGNRVENNLACSFSVEADKSARAEGNREVDEASFRKRWDEITGEIEKRYGETHPLAGSKRVSGF